MLSKKWLVNICLAALTVFFGFEAYDSWNREVRLPEGPFVGEPVAVSGLPIVANKQPLAASNYELVVEKNLFAPERKEIISDEPETESEKPKLTKADLRRIDRLNLLGVVISKDRKTALVQATKSKKDRSGSQWVVEGDEIEGMRVVEIHEEKVLLSLQDENIEILLYDPEKPKKRGTVKKDDQPTVMSTGDKSTGGASAGGAKTAQKQSTITSKETTQPSKKKTVPPRFVRPVLRKKAES